MQRYSGLVGTQRLTSLVCTASGNASQAWQKLGQNIARLAIGLGCQWTESQNCTHLTAKYCSRPDLNHVKYGSADYFILSGLFLPHTGLDL